MSMTRFHTHETSSKRGTIWHWFVAIQVEGDTVHSHCAYGEAAGVDAAQTCAEVIFQGIPTAELARVLLWTWDGHAIHATLRPAPDGVE